MTPTVIAQVEKVTREFTFCPKCNYMHQSMFGSYRDSKKKDSLVDWTCSRCDSILYTANAQLATKEVAQNAGRPGYPALKKRYFQPIEMRRRRNSKKD